MPLCSKKPLFLYCTVTYGADPPERLAINLNLKLSVALLNYIPFHRAIAYYS